MQTPTPARTLEERIAQYPTPPGMAEMRRRLLENPPISDDRWSGGRPGRYLYGMREARERVGFSQYRLALNMGYSAPNAAPISEWETLKRRASRGIARRIAEALGISVEELYAAPEGCKVTT